MLTILKLELSVSVWKLQNRNQIARVFYGYDYGSKPLNLVSNRRLFDDFFTLFHGSKPPIYDGFLWFQLGFTFCRGSSLEPSGNGGSKYWNLNRPTVPKAVADPGLINGWGEIYISRLV